MGTAPGISVNCGLRRQDLFTKLSQSAVDCRPNGVCPRIADYGEGGFKVKCDAKPVFDVWLSATHALGVGGCLLFDLRPQIVLEIETHRHPDGLTATETHRAGRQTVADEQR